MRREHFIPSPTPVEDYGSDPDQEWTVAGIVGQSIDFLGVERYEVKWGEGWQRADRTNTTWERPGTSDTVDGLIARWNEKQERRRRAAALRSPEIAVGAPEHAVPHEDRTVEELVRGYNTLVEVYPADDPRVPLDLRGAAIRLRPGTRVARVARVAASGSSGGSGKSSRSGSVGAGASAGASGRSAEKSSRSGSPEVPSPSPPLPSRLVRPIPRRAHVRRALSSPVSADEEKPDVARLPTRYPRREALEKQWAARLEGAAPVTIVNVVNSDEVPHLVDGFQYIERSYVRAPDVPATDHLADCLVYCHCQQACADAEQCGCQDPSELIDEKGFHVFAYSRRGLFNFLLPPGMEAIECNASCSCDDSCPNRVVQLPRDVPIEVFRTRNRGWGARATVALPRGKVVGIYTGQLTRREEAARRYDERRSYIFDLDVREGADDEDADDQVDRFSVDGHAYGNWTRFVNHSCEPNMRVYPVVWDTIPELNQPYLAFVATKDIPARTELTIDYDPKAGEEVRAARRECREELPAPEGARQCMCGAASCRGWVRV